MADSSASTSTPRKLIANGTPERSLNRQVVVEVCLKSYLIEIPPQCSPQEDEYDEALSHIIARDFFPSLAHLEATNTFLTSLDSQDPSQIQESVRRLSELRATPQRRTAWTQATPYDRTPYDTPLRTPRSRDDPGPQQPERPKIDTSLSLDAFQAKYTSEDNSSFTQILDGENRQRRERYGWAWDAEQRAGERKAKEIQGREQLLLTAAASDDSKRIAGSSTLTITATGEASTSSNELGSDPSTALVVASSPSAEEETEAMEVDVMARRKDTRSAIVPSWKFKVCT